VIAIDNFMVDILLPLVSLNNSAIARHVAIRALPPVPRALLFICGTGNSGNSASMWARFKLVHLAWLDATLRSSKVSRARVGAHFPIARIRLGVARFNNDRYGHPLKKCCMFTVYSPSLGDRTSSQPCSAWYAAALCYDPPSLE
jgi:hypothetical protein